tara:strand:+ start:6039 stop:6518 length:480 start_codon:yes stop_codon:yes gene_type:complete
MPRQTLLTQAFIKSVPSFPVTERLTQLMEHQCLLLAAISDLLGEGPPKATKAKKDKPRAAYGIQTYLDECEADQVDPIRTEHAVLKYAAEHAIPREFMAMAFHEFVERMTDNAKRQKNWPLTFNNYIRGNYLKLWWCKPDGSYELTSTGNQAMAKHGGR